MLRRCEWCGPHPLYQAYHDTEWGVPEHSADALFERLVLEGMQAGLSWWAVLQKRTHMQSAFFDFKPERLAEASDRVVDAWLCDPGIIRHRGKLVAMIGNARAFLQIADFNEFVWSVVGGRPVQNRFDKRADVPAKTEESLVLAEKLVKEGFRFVGPTTVYAFMQSAGLVNDHMTYCHRHEVCRVLGTVHR
jgi:DNA-3-methyladenine glycosylase I